MLNKMMLMLTELVFLFVDWFISSILGSVRSWDGKL